MIPAIVLAAGKSTRMGRTKALLPIAGATFLSRIVDTFRAAGADEIVVVLGHDADRVRDRHETCDVRFVVNQGYERGQLSSLVAGINAIARPDVEAVLWTVVDVPLVSEATVRAVVERYRATGAPLVRPVHGGRHGHPVLASASLFDELRSADQRHGAKSVVRAHASAAGDVEVEDEGAFVDIDTPVEYDRLTTNLRTRC